MGYFMLPILTNHICVQTQFSVSDEVQSDSQLKGREKESSLSVRHLSRVAQLHTYVRTHIWEEVSLSDASVG